MEIEDAQRQLQLPPQTTGMMIVMTWVSEGRERQGQEAQRAFN